MRRGNPATACLVGLGLLACSPIIESMLEKPRDGSQDDARPDTPDVPPDRDVPPDVVLDDEDDPVELLPIAINSECATTSQVMGAGFRLEECGDDAPDTGEKCDDGNTQNADGCDPYCLYETRVCNWAEPVDDPGDIAVEGGYAYVSDATLCVIIRINMGDGSSALLAGSPGDCGWADGAAAEARFNAPRGVEIMGGFLFVVDSGNDRIRRVDLTTGATVTLAGNGSEGIYDDLCPNAMFRDPTDLASDGNALYVADTGNGLVRAIRAPLDSDLCRVEHLAGSPLVRPKGLAYLPVDPDHLYISDEGTNRIYRLTLSSTVLEAIAGTGSATYADNPVGLEASFDSPQGIDSNGIVLIVADAGNKLLREIRLEAPFPVTTMAGHDLTSGCADGITWGSAARMREPGCVVFEETGDSAFNKVFFCDEGCDAIRIVK